jgi:poly-gamma-glutamate system protein
MSEVTTNTGYLPAKQTTVNPNWAAVMVHLLKEAEVQAGDVVAVGVSGSFAAINVSVYAALETQKLRPVVISSASSSQWGANHPRFLWLDMERTLYARKIISFRSVAASLGGAEDRAIGLSDEGIRLLERAIRRNKIPMLEVENYAESVVERMRIYREAAGGAPIRAYVNVGGSTASVGTSRMKVRFQPGLNDRLPSGAAAVDSVMARFLEEGVPVIHLVQIDQLARRYGLPVQPTEMPPVGTGQIFLQRRYNPWLASGVLAVILASLMLFVRSGRGRMAFQRAGYEPDYLEPRV